MKNNNAKKIAVVGLGYVGLPLALLAARKGFIVTGIDMDTEKVEKINRGVFPFRDQELSSQFRRTKHFTVTTDFKALKQSSIIVICVPTPVTEQHLPDFRPLEQAARSIAENLSPGKLVILESTISPGITENILIKILEERSGLTAGEDFLVAHCPERINPGDVKWSIENIPRVVGGVDEASLRRAIEFYKTILSAGVTPMNSLQEAEAVKIVENAFRDINIAFVNELAQSFSRLKIDILNVINGASTKPFSFAVHYPGCGVGGHCIPVDPYYLIEYGKANGYHHDFLSLARRINESMPKFTADLAMRALNEVGIPVAGSRITLLGLAYKPDIEDTRESPSFKVIEYLEEYGADVATYDPFVPELSTAETLDEAMRHSKAAILATAHTDFMKALSPSYFVEHNVPVLVDGRNCMPKEEFERAGIVYKGIGR